MRSEDPAGGPTRVTSKPIPEPYPLNPNRPLINVYTCPKGHDLVTVDMAEGVTPFMVACRRRGCTEMAESGFYMGPLQIRLATHEWYHPLTDEYLTLGEETKEHVKMGGLLLRRIGVETPEAAKELEARRENIATVLWNFVQYIRKRKDVTTLRDLSDDAADHIIQEFVYK